MQIFVFGIKEQIKGIIIYKFEKIIILGNLHKKVLIKLLGPFFII